MAEFAVSPKLLQNGVLELQFIKTESKKANDELKRIAAYPEIKDVGKRIQQIVSDLDNDVKKIELMRSNLGKIIDGYIKCEEKLAETENTPWYIEWIKSILDIGKEAGSLGKIASLPIAVLKYMLDGGELTPKNIGSLLNGLGNSVVAVAALDRDHGWRKFFGLDKFETIVTDSAAGWLGRASKTFKDTFKDEISPIESSTRKIRGGKAAGWALSLLANGFANYEEYKSGEINGERAAAETVSETVVDVLKGAALTAGVAAGFAAVGTSASVVVVGGVTVVAGVVMDMVSKAVTGKGFTEWASDTVLDALPAVLEQASGAIHSLAGSVGKWCKTLGFAT